jgi:NADPH:quinone reductase-like Zn-dependent oxidoreductase
MFVGMDLHEDYLQIAVMNDKGKVLENSSTKALEQIVDGVAEGRYLVNLHKVFQLDENVEAHHYMEENRSKGKLVVVVDRGK